MINPIILACIMMMSKFLIIYCIELFELLRYS